VVHWGSLHSVKFKQSLILDNKGDEMRLRVTLNIRLSLLNSLLVLFQNIFAVLEGLSPGLRIDTAGIVLEFIQL
jgi:hypothetical protein